MQRVDYNLDLFLALNKEYESKPIVPAPRVYTPAAIREHGSTWAGTLQERFGIAGKTVLEIGCGRGDVAHALVTEHGCKTCGLDIEEHKEWNEWGVPNLQFQVLDISREDHSSLGQFDFIYSLVAWEHIEHPFSALKAAKEHLSSSGKFYLYVNLYRGPMASHLYRDVFFPWPHLLFADSVFIQFYEHIGKEPQRPLWVNKLTAAQHLLYFDLVGLKAEQVWYSVKEIDEAFYTRFEDVLGRYPRFDLERDFLHAVLSHVDHYNSKRHPEALGNAP